jgi:hypothetical protein
MWRVVTGRGSKVRRFRGSGVERFKGSGFRGSRLIGSGVQGSEV